MKFSRGCLFFCLCAVVFSAWGEETCPANPDPNRGLANLGAIVNQYSCDPLRPGQARDFNLSDEESPTGLEHAYRLRRTSNGQYEVVFNVKFYEGGRDRASKFDPELTRQWTARANECLRSVDGRARGPAGERINFRLYDGPEEGEPPRRLVQIKDTGRPNSRSWTRNLECSGIFHELLHLAGLVDEYPEQQAGYSQNPETGEWQFVPDNPQRTAFNCRQNYERNSIMGIDSQAWADNTARTLLRIEWCQCRNAATCESHFRERGSLQQQLGTKGSTVRVEYPRQCPPGFARTPHRSEFPIPDDVRRLYEEGKPFGVPGPPGDLPREQLERMVPTYTFVPRPAASRPSILEPRHFNAIVFPGCLSLNAGYYRDSQNAYRTTSERGGEGCTPVHWCGRPH